MLKRGGIVNDKANKIRSYRTQEYMPWLNESDIVENHFYLRTTLYCIDSFTLVMQFSYCPMNDVDLKP